MKRFLAISCVFAMLLGVTACGTDTGAGGNMGAKVTEEDLKTAPRSKIEWAFGIQYSEKNTHIIKYFEDKYNVEFNFWGDAATGDALAVKLAANEFPDILRITNTTVNVPNYVKQGVIAPITQAMWDKVPNYRDFVNKVDPDYNEFTDVMIKGEIYGFKQMMYWIQSNNIMVWNKEWLTNVGINEVPKTLAEFEKAAYAFANNDPNKSGRKDTYAIASEAMHGVIGAFGHIPLKNMFTSNNNVLIWKKMDNGSFEIAAIQPEMKEALALLAKWYKDGLIDPEFPNGEAGSYWATSVPFLNGKIGITGNVQAMHWNPPLVEGARGGAVYEEAKAVNPNIKFNETYALSGGPVGPNGVSGTFGQGRSVSNCMSFTTSLMKDPIKTERLFAILNDTNTDWDTFVMAADGVEGKDWTYNEATKTRVRDAQKYATTTDFQKLAGGGLLNVLPNNDFEIKSNPLYYDFVDKYGRTTMHIEWLVPATETGMKVGTDLRDLTLQTYFDIITGKKPLAYFDEYVALLNKNGGEQWTKELNEAYLAGKKK